MIPEEKAIELKNKFRHFVGVVTDADGDPINSYLVSEQVAKKSALICIDEIISEHTYHNAVNWSNQREERKLYWHQVKIEINKLLYQKK